MTELTHDRVVNELCIPLAEGLWRIYHGEPGAAHLIFPRKHRLEPPVGYSRRISEQESRILLCQILEDAQRLYSVETPTTANYIQHGKHEMHARADVTIHADAADDPLGRILNVELKAQLPPVVSFTKDFEKLARENIPGLWFHTLEHANHRTFITLASKMMAAWDVLRDRSIVPAREITFAVCVLDPPRLYIAPLPPDGSVGQHEPSIFDPDSPAWTLYPGLRRGALGG